MLLDDFTIHNNILIINNRITVLLLLRVKATITASCYTKQIWKCTTALNGILIVNKQPREVANKPVSSEIHAHTYRK